MTAITIITMATGTSIAIITNQDRDMVGTFYGVGLGPGDPELITQKAVRVLREVDCIFLPASKNSGSSVARRIVAPLHLPESKFRSVGLCMGRDRREDQRTYADTADVIAAEVRQGKSAAWIAEGDPLLYSTFLHVYAEMQERHPDVRIEIVPGVSSPHAAAARAGMPLAYLDELVALVPAAYALDRVPAVLEEFATVCLLKVNAVFDRLLEVLPSWPQDIEATYLENIGTPEERMITNLEALRGREVPYFSLVLLRRRSSVSELTATMSQRERSRERQEERV
jgi:precorrin-2/cobalt-factor-2 C20-methyltransferase